MALGGGTYTFQNKILPGSYVNFVSAARAYGISRRGIAALPVQLDWGVEDKVFEVSAEQFRRYSLKLFGYPLTDERMKGMRDLFRHCEKAYFYRLNKGAKATCQYADARYSGTKGNDLKVVIKKDADSSILASSVTGTALTGEAILGRSQEKYRVQTLMGFQLVDEQIVTEKGELADNDYLVWKKEMPLEETASTPLTGGTSGEPVTGTEYQAALDALESYHFQVLGCLAATEEVKKLFVAYVKRMREQVGVKFVVVMHKQADSNYEGVISVENDTKDSGWSPSSAVYWVTGAQAGCAVNQALTNTAYDGEFELDLNYTQTQREEAMTGGQFIFHRVDNDVRVLDDINTFTAFTEEKREDFKRNQVIRVLDQIGNDIAALFNNKYLGKIPNDAAGRVSFWSDVVTHHKQLEALRAIENFDSENVKVQKGDKPTAIVVTDHVTPVNAMTQLYMTVIVS